MLLEEFDYDLPGELIAQRPLAERDASRLLVVDRKTQTFEDRLFRELPEILQQGDLLVFNNTRVFPARLLGRRLGVTAQKIGKHNPARHEFLQAEVELFLARQETADTWQALVRPGRKVRTGEILIFGDNQLEAEVLGRGAYGLRRVRLRAERGALDEAIDRLGHVPLPPYIHRPDDAADRLAYQTIYAKARGAIAAPTAGLHFTQPIFDRLRARGIGTSELTLHVGLGTFQPVHAESVEDHKMEPERFEIPPSAADAASSALDEGRRIVAVGTTTARAFEHVARTHHGRIVRGAGETNLFIYPGFNLQVVGALLTNFHLPRSTLLMLVAAFAGPELTLRAYQHAVRERYRFYSYGDCVLIV